ncbi:MAG: methionyl-tRNA synthetase [Candidatus Berkelbacteria bacterium Licking1014_2]|uniref:Methionine--tRNA ligase n=1 Tax=Candidatus Berkelbacteria bacterium Licking1014_2 TaxID=2017146 RepID=A0A554LX54_9BACT|nr:MAG: methionyl-tRNA synthetase [Candidatus Berkelbacteria bacterium Licking1014_2]
MKFITTSIVYTNADPHIGFAMELIQADVLARFWRQQKEKVLFSTGVDEHGMKIYRSTINLESQKSKVKSQNIGIVKKFVNEKTAKYQRLTKTLNISNDDFIRTTDKKRHWPAVGKIWRQLASQGDIYKKSYEGWYCSGCEAFLRPRDLVDNRCPNHQEPELIKEENYFFNLTKYLPAVIELIQSDKIKILPETRKAEILSLAEDSQDVSFSRPAEKLPWGIPVPDDPSQTIYVWCDALTNYLSVIGYGQNPAKFKRWWPADIHLIGKDILRFHALIWPAMLLAADLELPKQIFVHGFINFGGQRVSKSSGNVVDPFILVDKYGVDAVRYFLLREIPSDGDGDFSPSRLEQRYNGDLADDLGNLLLRLLTLGQRVKLRPGFKPVGAKAINIKKEISGFKLHLALQKIWLEISELNQEIERLKLWQLIKDKPAVGREKTGELLARLNQVAIALEPFLPATSAKLIHSLATGEKIVLFRKGNGS